MKLFEIFLDINIKKNKIDINLLLTFKYYVFLNQQLENNGFIKYS